MTNTRRGYLPGWNKSRGTATILANGALRIQWTDENGDPEGPSYETNKPRAGKAVQVQREVAGRWTDYEQIGRHGRWRGDMAFWASDNQREAAKILAHDFRLKLVTEDA